MTKKKRIYFLVSNDLRQDQRMHRICSSLEEVGMDCTLVGRKHRNSPPFKTTAFSYKRLKCFFTKGFSFYLEYNIRLFFFLSTQQFDAICANDLDTLLPAGLITRLKGKLLVHDAHEFFIESIEIVDRPIVQQIWTWIGQRMVPRAKYCYTVNTSLAKKLSEIYNQNFEVIRNVPVLQKDARFINKHEGGRPVILYQGVLNTGRGLELLLECVPELDAELWIVGEGGLKSSLIAQADQLGISDKVVFKGFITGDELKQITKQAYIGINILSPESGNYQFSLANKTFDYMHAGVPAIHMDFPEYEKINQEFEIALLIENYTKASLAKAINYLLQDKATHARLKENCYKARQVYHWEKESQKLINLYKHWLTTY